MVTFKFFVITLPSGGATPPWTSATSGFARATTGIISEIPECPVCFNLSQLQYTNARLDIVSAILAQELSYHLCAHYVVKI
ncbi:hypothetical protein EVAR_102521_1 [Eumeta japonica]|uniref:Secreted protein n=1 Tax=Eumeta variegata TaxID=151549 RepID=A0A4C1ST90_EUMVA|nr:hypothetical protein EVAR_102521_1 [Eumeta japonica]